MKAIQQIHEMNECLKFSIASIAEFTFPLGRLNETHDKALHLRCLLGPWLRLCWFPNSSPRKATQSLDSKINDIKKN